MHTAAGDRPRIPRADLGMAARRTTILPGHDRRERLRVPGTRQRRALDIFRLVATSPARRAADARGARPDPGHPAQVLPVLEPADHPRAVPARHAPRAEPAAVGDAAPRGALQPDAAQLCARARDGVHGRPGGEGHPVPAHVRVEGEELHRGGRAEADDCACDGTRHACAVPLDVWRTEFGVSVLWHGWPYEPILYVAQSIHFRCLADLAQWA